MEEAYGLWMISVICSNLHLRFKRVRPGCFEHKPIVLWENTSRGGQRGHFLFAGENPPGISNTSSKPRAVTSQSTFITFYISDASNGNVKLTITDPVKHNKKIIDTTVAAGIHRIAWDLKFDAPSLTDKEIKTIDSLVMSIPEVENSSLTALRRLKQAKTSSEQRQFVEHLVNLNSGIPIPEKLLPVKAVPGLYSIELNAGTILQKANLKINGDPLNKK